jgi:hypothetical protein
LLEFISRLIHVISIKEKVTALVMRKPTQFTFYLP